MCMCMCGRGFRWSVVLVRVIILLTWLALKKDKRGSVLCSHKEICRNIFDGSGSYHLHPITQKPEYLYAPLCRVLNRI